MFEIDLKLVSVMRVARHLYSEGQCKMYLSETLKTKLTRLNNMVIKMHVIVIYLFLYHQLESYKMKTVQNCTVYILGTLGTFILHSFQYWYISCCSFCTVFLFGAFHAILHIEVFTFT